MRLVNKIARLIESLACLIESLACLVNKIARLVESLACLFLLATTTRAEENPPLNLRYAPFEPRLPYSVETARGAVEDAARKAY